MERNTQETRQELHDSRSFRTLLTDHAEAAHGRQYETKQVG